MSEPRPDLISVIIPTYRRPKEVRAAALSALEQTWPEVEVVVVSDGHDDATRASLEDLADKLLFLELPYNQGPAAARNAGVLASKGCWLAFLDDDDLMLPERLQRQMLLTNPTVPQKMIACRSWYRHGSRMDLWPEIPIGADEDVADYLLLRPSLLGRPGVISIQSLLMHRAVVEAVPFASYADHEDWGWLLRAWHEFGARVEFCWEPLVIYNIDVSSNSRSRRLNWEDSLEWAQEHRCYIGDRAFCSFLASKVALKAKRAGDWSGLREIAKEVAKNRPGLLEIAFLAGIACLPGTLIQGAWRQSLRGSSQEPEGVLPVSS